MEANPQTRHLASKERRRTPLRVTALAAVALLLGGCLSPEETTASSFLNRDRLINGVLPLPEQSDAQKKAQAWADELAAKDVLTHSNLPDDISTRWCSLGENVGVGPSVELIEPAFMASPHHRDNIVGTRYNGVGVGVSHHGPRTYVVQEFIQTC